MSNRKISAKLKQYGPQALRSGLAYGIGLLVGVGLASIFFNVVTLELFADLDEAVRLLIGVILAFFIAGVAGAVGGFVGGFSLPQLDAARSRWGYAWRSAFSISIPFALSLYPILLVFSLIAFFNSDDPGRVSIVIVTLVGVIFGTLASIIMGLLSIGRRGFSALVWAGAVGFGLGGILLGIGLRFYVYSILNTELASGQRLWLVLGFFAFGLIGGSAWGYVFARLADAERSPIRPGHSWIRYALATLFILFTIIFLRPLFAALGDMLTPQSADLVQIFDEDSKGVHWSEPMVLAAVGGGQSGIAAVGDRVAVTWSDDQTLFFSEGFWDRDDNVTEWRSPVEVSTGVDMASAPQIVLDAGGQSHVIWVENSFLLSSSCANGSCTQPSDVSGRVLPACTNGERQPSNPTLSIGSDGRLLAVWQNGDGALVYSSWFAGDLPSPIPDGCVPQTSEMMGNSRLAALADGRFILTYEDGTGEQNEISLVEFGEGKWGTVSSVGNGRYPFVYVAAGDQIHAAWCNNDGLVSYWRAGIEEIVADLPCLGRPELAMDSTNQMHISWYANQVENNVGQKSPASIIYESVRGDSSWGVPAIVALDVQSDQPVLAEAGGDLHLAWMGGDQFQYASQLQYDCNGYELSDIGQQVFNVARSPNYRTEDTVVPYCRNQYDRLIFAPNPNPAFSDEPISTNGAYDRLAELIVAAQYEVLYSNMWYDEDSTGSSPGRVLADGVAALYENLKAHPEQYPRGITVRILLGHPPESTRGEFAGQIWHVLNDLRNAGVPEMENDELGWLVEVANFEGTLPHSHIKSLIVDGKTVVAAGFNLSYEHYDGDHPSELGNGRFDLGIQVTGPVAQDARRMFDDLWLGADRLHCTDFDPEVIPWQSTCLPRRATSEHMPEVMKYYLTQGDTTAFSMYRTEARDEADQQILAALSSAEKSIDAIHVNFTAELICDLNILYDQVCTADQLLPYMEAMLDAAESHGTQIRIMIKGAPIDGVESGVHLAVLNDALEKRGISDKVEVRLFDGPMHPKATLIDGEFLIIGSQNFHYSAFGEEAGLAEYSLGVEDNEAIADFQRLYEYQWEQAVPSS